MSMESALNPLQRSLVDFLAADEKFAEEYMTAENTYANGTSHETRLIGICDKIVAKKVDAHFRSLLAKRITDIPKIQASAIHIAQPQTHSETTKKVPKTLNAVLDALAARKEFASKFSASLKSVTSTSGQNVSTLCIAEIRSVVNKKFLEELSLKIGKSKMSKLVANYEKRRNSAPTISSHPPTHSHPPTTSHGRKSSEPAPLS